MAIIRLEKKEVAGFLDALREKWYSIWAPQDVGGGVEFRPLEDVSRLVLNHANSRLSPKDLVFPQSERMFVFSTDRKREGAFILKEVPGEDNAQLVFGIRPCDARAFDLLDKVFLSQGTEKDPYYLRKRKSTILIGLGCNEPCSTCFCHWTGGAPFSTEGLDLLATELEDAFIIKTVSKEGEALLEGMGYLDADQEDVAKAEAIAEAALASMGKPLESRRIKERQLMEVFDDPYWETAHETCIKCGVCTYLCPTCSCFDIQDEVRRDCGFRCRNWDTCMFGLTTQHASGHNPRPTGKERFRQRFMHKLKYFQDDFDVIMCVGCGRCVQSCPVNIDIREIVEALSA